MNEQELRELRIAAELSAHRAVHQLLREAMETVLQSLESQQRVALSKVILLRIAELRHRYRALSFPDLQAAESDLYSAEVNDAFDRLADEIHSSIAPFTRRTS